MANFIGEGLGRPGDVAIDLEACARFAGAGVVHHKLQCLLSRPIFPVQSDVHHQAHRAEQFRIQAAVVLVRLGVKAELSAQAFRVKRPTFSEGIVIDEAPETGQALLLPLNRYLKVVPGNGFMEKQRLRGASWINSRWSMR